ncbi:hypothetical protein BHYA_0424g00010 [Botrytis hyacinthi]|uniref:Uncharacterized protein n=1 Tax=Botrytis hyacinthi TaxID=278943 RepID=A0A4Z1G8D9_9HELO|nr:hypothetical protein BHYA_0424g00010 [Botrytis hyacinthi]
MAPIPAQLRTDIKTHLEKVIEELEAHLSWSSHSPNPGLFFLWDFVRRGNYMLLEYDNILNGRPLQRADQFHPGPPALDCWDTFVAKCPSSVTIPLTLTISIGEDAALKVFQEVCARTLMLSMIVTDTTGRMRMMMGSGGSSVDYGENVRRAVRELEAAVPKEHMVAGMAN